MSIYKGNKKVIALYKGATPIKSVMKGTVSVFGSEGGDSGLKNTIIVDIDPSFLGQSELKIEDGTYTYGIVGGRNEIHINEDNYPITSLRYMCSENGLITNIEIYGVDTSSCENMSYMFSYTNVTELDLSSFNTSSLTNVFGMFSFCQSLQTLNVSGWDVSQIRSYSNMFDRCNALRTLILGNVTQDQYDWWYARLQNNYIDSQVTIEATIIQI